MTLSDSKSKLYPHNFSHSCHHDKATTLEPSLDQAVENRTSSCALLAQPLRVFEIKVALRPHVGWALSSTNGGSYHGGQRSHATTAMLSRIELPDFYDAQPPSPEAARLILEAHERIDWFLHSHKPPIHNFVACDFRTVNACLRWITEGQLTAGRAFCEWGAGFGVVTMLAALLEYDAVGIEVEPVLVDEARSLADDLEIAAQFATGSLIPAGGEDLVSFVDDITHIDTDSPDAYDEVGLEVDEQK